MSQTLVVPVALNGPRRFHVMPKPVGSLCNLDCTYCYYLSKQGLLHQPASPVMDETMLERFIAQYIAANDGPEVVFTWQGGEPTLLGIPYFKKIVALQQKHARPGLTLLNDLQTNGTRLDGEWYAFLRDQGFLVGLSVDGPAALHDRHRVSKGGKPTHAKVSKAAQELHRHAIPFSTLTCVNGENALHPIEVYRHLTEDLGSERLQFIPIVEARDFRARAPGLANGRFFPRPDSPRARPGHPLSVVENWSVAAADWGEFLVAVFDEWRTSDLGRVLVNWFETMVSRRLGLGAQMCVSNDFCGKNLAIEHNGEVFSCDHYAYPEHRLGNIATRDLGALAFSERQVAFGIAKRETLPDFCRLCPHLRDCWGECPKNRLLSTADGQPGLNYLCQGYRRFYGHAAPLIDELVATLA